MSRFAYEPDEQLIPGHVKTDDVVDRLKRRGKKRKWPDDFRGFGTNVKPKKQK